MANIVANQLNENDYLILDQLEKIYRIAPDVFQGSNKQNMINELINNLANELKGGAGLGAMFSQTKIHNNQIKEVFNQYIFRSDQGSYRGINNPRLGLNSTAYNSFVNGFNTYQQDYPGMFQNGLYSGLSRIRNRRFNLRLNEGMGMGMGYSGMGMGMGMGYPGMGMGYPGMGMGYTGMGMGMGYPGMGMGYPGMGYSGLGSRYQLGRVLGGKKKKLTKKKKKLAKKTSKNPKKKN